MGRKHVLVRGPTDYESKLKKNFVLQRRVLLSVQSLPISKRTNLRVDFSVPCVGPGPGSEFHAGGRFTLVGKDSPRSNQAEESI